MSKLTPYQAARISIINPPSLSWAISLIEHGGVFGMSENHHKFSTVKALLDGGLIEKVGEDKPPHRAQQYRVVSGNPVE